ncbi:MAG: ATP-binding protein [Actinomycetota bacterium]|nr:ATP-binding protein [Actinomycetota bacterium]
MKSLTRILFIRYFVTVMLILLPVAVAVIYMRSRFADAVVLAIGGLVLMGALTFVAIWARKSLERDLGEVSNALRRLVVENEIKRMPQPALKELSGLARDMEVIGSRVRRNVRLLERERDRLRTILDNIDIGIIVLGANGKTEVINPSAERLLGTTRDFALNRTFVEVHPDPSFERLVERAREESMVNEEIEISYPKRRILKATACAIKRKSGRFSGTLVAIEDVTAIRSLERARRDFVANVSHELRTPVANLRAVIESMIGAEEDSETRARFLDALDRESLRLAEIIEDLLVLSRMESDRIGMEEETFDVRRLLEEVEEEKQELASKYGIRLVFNVEEVEKPLLGDRKLIKTACLNLIDNAIKYNKPEGKVEVGLIEASDELAIVVSDEGIGIPESERTRIFERFYRVDKARSRETGGTGLGLSIVRHVAELHGGYVDLKTKEDEGSTFTLVIPRASAISQVGS